VKDEKSQEKEGGNGTGKRRIRESMKRRQIKKRGGKEK
jgi:hypothetical protein